MIRLASLTRSTTISTNSCLQQIRNVSNRNIAVSCRHFRSTHLNVHSPDLLKIDSRPSMIRCRPFNRSCSKSVEESDITSSKDAEDFVMIYKFPYIVQARIVNRLKIFQTIFTVVSVPPCWIFYANDLLMFDATIAVTFMSAFACFMLYVIGNIANRLIGIMYLNRSRDTLKISHLTFWGNRKDFTVSVNKVVPLSDIRIKESDVYLKLKMYDRDDVYYFVSRYGGIVNKEMFERVFGSIEYLKNYGRKKR